MEITKVLNLSNEDYHNSEQYKKYWSSSNIKYYLETPREANYQKFFAPKKQSTAMDFGTMVHDFFESKHVTGSKFNYNEFEPPINAKTGKPYGPEAKAYQFELSQIENPVSADAMQSIEEIYRMIMNSHYRWYFEKVIFSTGIAEASFFIEAGIHRYKFRADVLTDRAIFDYKTIGKRDFYNRRGYVIRERMYDISAAFYQFFENQRTGIWKPFYIIWLMKDPPYDILIQDISPFCYEVFGNNEPIVNNGAMTFLKLKEQHELCEVSQQWPGMANQFEKQRGIRLAETYPRFERGFNEFEIE